ncbi:hypothetical protein [Bacillus massiliigorillae]|uniref:hypothetical protein n=1 Tax=Bacillus massiliigorillae TaxID=1243664 RepID=UPI00039A4400|nr:hypothetical protein [Bacillus massiliigorillae]
MGFQNCYCSDKPCSCRPSNHHHHHQPEEVIKSECLAFGSLYNPNPIPPALAEIPVVQGALVDFTQLGPFRRVLPDVATDSITVLSSGIYEITFGVNVLQVIPADALARVYVNIYINGEVDQTSSASLFNSNNGTGSVSHEVTLSRTIERFLNEGDIITLRFSFVAGEVQTYGNASLVVDQKFKMKCHVFE